MTDGNQNTEQESSKVKPKKEEENPNEKMFKLGPNLICAKENHYFIYKSGIEVICKTCPIGYSISPGTEIKNGHLYIHGEFVL